MIEALCFDFAVENPHAKLADMFEAHEVDDLVQEHAWSFAHDSFALRSFRSVFIPYIIQILDIGRHSVCCTRLR